ncbi:MAG: PVC-type heme-binding CxxCH protein [Planctomycetia bacterium]
MPAIATSRQNAPLRRPRATADVRRALLTAACLTLACLPTRLNALEPALVLRKGDSIAVIGNALADRMQQSGWLETRIHAAHPDLELVVRNLGFAGDELTIRHREENFGSPDQWLAKVKASVVFCFFGHNEALRKGAKEVDGFQRELAATIDGMRGQKYDGQSPPRLVFFSPIAHENLRDPNLPDGSANNKNLALYTDAMRQVCADKGVVFVDLFAPTQALYAKAAKPLTMNGIHLLDDGERAVADVIMDAVFPGAKSAAEPALERLRQAVLDKNYYWFSRYRVIDGYNVFGGRSKLAWFGQSNADVMMREMEIFDVMTANRDARVWAIARGGDLVVKDDNLPPQLEVKTNIPGKLEEGRHEYLGGREAIGKMKVAEGMQVNLFASEEMFPELVNPVQMAVDPDGRLFVATWPSYPHWNPTEPRLDKIVCLPDDNGDGVADRCVTFADGLNSVTGFEFWGGGMIVAALPELWFLKDTDGDGRADFKLRILQGLDSADSHHSANAMLIGPDGWLYWSRGVFNVSAMETPTRTVRSDKTGVHRFNPRTFEVEFHFPIGPNPHGDVFDQWGYQFANDGTTGVGSYVNIGRGVGNKPWFEKRVRPVAATGLLSSSHFPEKNQGNFLVCNTIGFLGVLQHEVKYDGADIVAKEIEPIIVSSDPNFRPSDLEIGADGALYVSDWANAIIGHMQHNMRDPNRDHSHGRIYRVTAKDRPLVKPVRLKGKPIAEVLQQAFFAKENTTRYRGRLELSGRKTADVVAAVRSWTKPLDPANPEHAQALLECLWVFEEHRTPDAALLERVFAAGEPRVRAAAIRTLGHWGETIPGWNPLLLSAAADASPLVRAEAVKAAAAIGPAAAEAVFEAAAGPTDRELDTVLAYAPGKVQAFAVLRNAVAAKQPLSGAAMRYMLRHAPVEDLLRLERTEAVCDAIIDRPKVPIEAARQAVASLAGMRKAGDVPVLLDLIRRREAANGGEAIAGLGRLLAEQPSEQLKAERSAIETLAAKGATGPARQAAYAAWIGADGSGDGAFLAASRARESLRDVLAAVPGVADEKLRGRLYAAVRPLLFELPPGLEPEPVGGAGRPAAAGESVHELAIRTLPAIPGHEAEKFADLTAIVKADRHRAAAIAALGTLPDTAWAAQEIPELADNLVGYLSGLPAAARTAPAAAAATKLVRALAGRLPADRAKAITDRLQNLDVRVIAIGTVFERMIFDKETLVVQAGKPVEFRFSNGDAMPHNFVILKPGALAEVGLLAEATARDADAKDRHYVPKSDKVLLASRLLESGQTQTLAFETPKDPGVYPYVCTYPGHWRRMLGAMYVVPDLAAYEANPQGYLAATPLPIRDEMLAGVGRNTDWQYDDLIATLKPLPAGRSFEVGRRVFAAANCVGCHKFGGEGNDLGPDLTRLAPARQSPEILLRSLCEPSHEIADKYRSHTFVLDSGKVVTGMIMAETPAEIRVMVDPLARCEPTVVRKDEIEDRKMSPVSIMPKGLLNRLSREEILDLVAYVISRADKTSPVYAAGK